MYDFNEMDTVMVTSGGRYSSNKINRFASSIVDMLAEEEMSYEEAMFVLRSSEDYIKARARLVKPVKGF